jgi:molecular chaperone GrpE
MAAERGAARLAGELVAALDNFELALAASAAASDSDPSAEATVRGFSLIRDELLAGLGRAGVEIDRPTEGEKFDPQVHEAIAHVPAEGAEAGSIVAVHQAGYRLGSTVIRPARVAVAGG